MRHVDQGEVRHGSLGHVALAVGAFIIRFVIRFVIHIAVGAFIISMMMNDELSSACALELIHR